MLRRFFKAIAVWSLIFLSSASFSVAARDLILSVAYIPLLAESPEQGAYIDFMKALDQHYTSGEFEIGVYPFARSLKNVIDGQADMHIPMIRSPYKVYEGVPYQLSQESTGEVCFVIYSHVDNPITKADLLADREQALVVDTVRGIQELIRFPFNIQEISEIDHGLIRILHKRIDAFLFAQEETDYRLRELKLKQVHREPMDCYDEVIVLPQSEEGNRLNKELSAMLKTLRTSGVLDELRKPVHVPYIPWQPSTEF